jgi:hypothetical protein
MPNVYETKTEDGRNITATIMLDVASRKLLREYADAHYISMSEVVRRSIHLLCEQQRSAA